MAGRRGWHRRLLRALDAFSALADATPAHQHDARVCATILRAIDAGVRRTPDALQLARDTDSITRVNDSRSPHYLYIRFVAARLFEMLGDLEAARTAVNRIQAYDGTELFQESRLRESARLSERLGDRERAIAEYATYLGFRGSADARGESFSEQARQALAQLTREGAR